MRAQDALPDAIRRLTAAGVPDAIGDARRLLAHAMLIAPDRLTLHLPDPLPPDAAARFETVILARCNRQPVSQITGLRQFYGRSFRVTPDVLDPRPETETLIVAALAGAFTTVLDLGTGTGCILLTLLAERPEATGIGSDVSEKALAIARTNAGALGLSATLIQSDWFAGISGRFDLITANPPYIAAAELAHLAPEVRDWEPHIALTPGGDGLDPYRALTAGAPMHLTPGGRMVVEIGATQGPQVAALMRAAGLTQIRVLPDMDGRDRVVVGCAA